MKKQEAKNCLQLKLSHGAWERIQTVSKIALANTTLRITTSSLLNFAL